MVATKNNVKSNKLISLKSVYTKKNKSTQNKANALKKSYTRRIIASDEERASGVDLTTLSVDENGFTPGFQKELEDATAEMDAAIKNGTAKLYSTVEELFESLEADDEAI